MRREGVLSGYLWNKNLSEKVKVYAKPTNASKSSGSGRAKRLDQPGSKARAKTKGRNKRVWSRVLVDDEWAFCKRCPVGRVKRTHSSLLSHVNYGGVIFAYDGPDADHRDAGLFGDDGAYCDAYDACCAFDVFPVDAISQGPEIKGTVLDVRSAVDIHKANDVSNASTHTVDAVKCVGVLMHAAVPDVHAENFTRIASDVKKIGFCAALNHVITTDIAVVNDDNVVHSKNNVTKKHEDVATKSSNIKSESHASKLHALDNVSNDVNADADGPDAGHRNAGLFGHNDVDDGAYYGLYDACCAHDVFPVDAISQGLEIKGIVRSAVEINVANDVSNASTHTLDAVKCVGMLTHEAMPDVHAENFTRIASDVKNIGFCAAVNHVITTDITVVNDDNVAHSKNNVIKEPEDVSKSSDVEAESHASKLHALDDASDDADAYANADDLCSDADADYLLSLISALTDGKWSACCDTVLEIEGEVDSLSSDWCFVPDNSDDDDDWYLC